MRGNDVQLLQTRLKNLGYVEVGNPDGVFGPKSDKAVRHFQEVNQLTVDGKVGPITWKKLFGDAAVPNPD